MLAKLYVGVLEDLLGSSMIQIKDFMVKTFWTPTYDFGKVNAEISRYLAFWPLIHYQLTEWKNKSIDHFTFRLTNQWLNRFSQANLSMVSLFNQPSKKLITDLGDCVIYLFLQIGQPNQMLSTFLFFFCSI